MNYSLVIPYSELTIPARGSFPPKIVYKPLLKTFLLGKRKRVPLFHFSSIVDSGADFCVFPMAFGEMIGVDVEKGDHLPSFGVGGKETLYFHNVRVGVEVQKEIWEFKCRAGFSRKMDEKGFGLLGRDGFFDLFSEVAFNQSKRMFRLRGQGGRPRAREEEIF